MQPAEPAREFFLCHVSDDKDTMVRPLARALEAQGMSCWLDEAEILVGDSLITAVQTGLKSSRYLVCFITDAFFERGWPNAELEAALSMQLGGRAMTVLPIIDCDTEKYKADYALLSPKKAARWSDGIDGLVAELRRVRDRDARQDAPTDAS